MNKEAYLKKFSCAARWRLSAPEAEEVISDYAEMMEDTGEALEEKWGTPMQAARLLGNTKAYYKWLALFVAFVALLAFAELPILSWHFWNDSYLIAFGSVLAGLLLALWGFRPYRSPCARPKGLLLALGLIFLLAGGMVWLMGMLLNGEIPSVPDIGWRYANLLRVSSMIAMVTGVWAIAAARTKAYHWRALYAACLMCVGICWNLSTVIFSMNIEMEIHTILVNMYLRCGGLLGIGLVGVILCLKKI